MCNLYSLTKGQAAIRDWFRVRHDRTGNLPLFPGVFRDQMAPIVRTAADAERELVMARWGITPAEVDQWLEADTLDALALQRPLPNDALRIVVAKGEKEDSSAEVTM